ncbi:MAG: Fe-S cluster assembly sulfur transfer protein SufU [Brevinema sp.]
MLENLANLYQELIIEHSKNPRNAGVLDVPHVKKGLGINPSCGDKLLLSIHMDNDKLVAIKHDSDGCSIFRASCSLMSQLLMGKKKEEILEILEIYMRLITFDEDNKFSVEEKQLLGKLQVFENVRNYPARVKCAALFTRTLQDLLINYDSEDDIITSTEDEE